MSRNVAALDRQRKRHRITHDQIAAACDPPVHRTMVSKVLNARATSARVVATTQRLILEAKLADAKAS